MCFYQDAFDAVGYFQLALAAALEDHANPEALYVVYMKLAEIHGHHMPDAQLCQAYRDRAQSLKRVLAGQVDPNGEEEWDNPDTEPGQREETVSEDDKECADFNAVSCTMEVRNTQCVSLARNNPIPEDENCEDGSFTQTCRNHIQVQPGCADCTIGDANRREDHNNACLPDTNGVWADATGSETGHSYTNSNHTDSFETANEQISDSSDSSDTLQTDLCQTAAPHGIKDHSDFDTLTRTSETVPVDNNMGNIIHAAGGRTGIQTRETYSHQEENIPPEETYADLHKIDPIHKNGTIGDKQSYIGQTETANMDTDKADTTTYYTGRDKSETADTDTEHMYI